MILYNTTYQMAEADARNFVIWVHQVMLPRVKEFGYMQHGRLSRILSHKEEGTECFALQFEVESTARLHYWFVKQGKALSELPPREVLLARVVGPLQAPVAKLVYFLEALRKKQAGEE